MRFAHLGEWLVKEIWVDHPVSGDQVLWRYFRFDRFMEAIESRTLYFASAREFDDPFEGATAVTLPAPKDPRFNEIAPDEKAFEELRRLTKISCWNRGASESEAMWKLYASERKGIAVKTTAKKLAESLQPYRLSPEYADENFVWGEVRYVDLTSVRLNEGMLARFFCKHLAFESERELRVAISLRLAEEYGVNVPERGIRIHFVPETLLQQVILGPELPTDQRNEAVNACTRLGLGHLVETSTLLWTPRYT
ncbi:DUF2971 domain-containing protein [Caballeronia sp. SBC2]|uniref:DUF2971 domain-containing protein n=1 Tax=Caballeronia sp. SBC2 TaxID=2705547 RepID=UPI001F1509F6|nr:DUF2971 domain-containing protein [Caballeronia sp. SBC2]